MRNLNTESGIRKPYFRPLESNMIEQLGFGWTYERAPHGFIRHDYYWIWVAGLNWEYRMQHLACWKGEHETTI